MNYTQLVHNQIDKILYYYEPLLPLANCHMVDYFTKHLYKKNIDENIQHEINLISSAIAIEKIFNRDFSSIPHLSKYIEICKQFSIKGDTDVCLSAEQFHKKLESLGAESINSLKMDIFMSQKKSHEVETLSSIVAALKDISSATHVVDIGDGKGYLSSMVALHHKIPVLGIDASAGNLNAAVKRVQKLEKIWHSVYENPKKSHPKKGDKNFTPSCDLYKQVTKFITPDICLKEIVSENFHSEVKRVSIVGLHTCGNLATTSIKLYAENEYISSLLNVGCCYHLLDERIESDQISDVGFPLSDYLIRKKICLGRNARMVASQSIDRILHNRDLPDISIFYRALLQVLLERTCRKLPTKNIGKMRKKYSNFREYVEIALKKLELDSKELNISEQDIQNLYNEYLSRLDELNVFHLMRSMTSPLTESIILMDRLLYLLEQGYENSWAVQLFDPIISPRCYGIISIKK